MSSAYGDVAGPAVQREGLISSALPLKAALKGSSLAVELDHLQERDVVAGHKLLNLILDEGLSWPFEELMDETGFRRYFMSHNAYCIRCAATGQLIGQFYIKPNFPGRCSHICNGGFITEPAYRGQGVGSLMAEAFQYLAQELGYRASYFNLVFANNTASLALWDSMGFTRLAVIPKAGRLKGMKDLVDAVQYHKDLEALTTEHKEAFLANFEQKL